jgi:uncharacterized oxidoreductase
MQTTGNTVLITGGASGIGLALAQEFVSAGNTVIVCGRTEARLEEAKRFIPQIHVKRSDVSKAKERNDLVDFIGSNYGSLNVLVNNAGIQRMIDLTHGVPPLLEGDDEIEINFRAPVHLSSLFVPLLAKHKEAAIINVSSGLAFVPLAIAPIYCATKAALHSFTMSLRHQLRDTNIRVFELIPPMVDTELDKGARDRRGPVDRGIPASHVARAAFIGLDKDEYEIAVGGARDIMIGSRNNPEQLFRGMNSR